MTAQRGSGVDAAERAGITYRQLDYYLRTGLVVPVGREARGCGTQRELADADIDALRVVGKLMALTPQSPTGAKRPVRDVYMAIAAHVQAHGPVGTFELIPGVTVDVARLVADLVTEVAA